jgi:hypothetical protein
MNARKSLKSLLAVLLVAVLSVLGMGVAQAADGSLSNYVNDYRNKAGLSSLPNKSELTQQAQQKAQQLADADARVPKPVATSTLVPIQGSGESVQSMFMNTWAVSPDITSTMTNKRWTHIGSGEAKGASGKVYGVTLLAYYEPPAPVPVPVPAPVVDAAPPAVQAPIQEAPAPVVEHPAPAPVQEPVQETPAPAPVEAPKETPVATPTPTVEPTPTVSATPTPEPTATETQAVAEPTESAVPLDGSQTGQATPISKETVKAGVGGLGILFALFAGFNFLRAAQHRKVANSVFTSAA